MNRRNTWCLTTWYKFDPRSHQVPYRDAQTPKVGCVYSFHLMEKKITWVIWKVKSNTQNLHWINTWATLHDLWTEHVVFLADNYLFTAAAHTQGSVFISHNDTWARATQITVTRQRLPKPFTLLLVAGHGALSPWVNESRAGQAGNDSRELRSRADDEAN